MMHLSLRSRPHVERRVLLLLRGAPLAIPAATRRGGNMPEPTPAHFRRFAHLRRVAVDHGLVVQSPAMPYVGKDELRLLAWLAEAQRTAGPSTAPDTPELLAAIVACAALLDGLGLRLSPITLCACKAAGHGNASGIMIPARCR